MKSMNLGKIYDYLQKLSENKPSATSFYIAQLSARLSVFSLLKARGQYSEVQMTDVPKVNCLLLRPRS